MVWPIWDSEKKTVLFISWPKSYSIVEKQKCYRHTDLRVTVINIPASYSTSSDWTSAGRSSAIRSHLFRNFHRLTRDHCTDWKIGISHLWNFKHRCQDMQVNRKEMDCKFVKWTLLAEKAVMAKIRCAQKNIEMKFPLHVVLIIWMQIMQN
jgi:hypothetical protein